MNNVETGCRAALGIVFAVSTSTKISRAAFAEFLGSVRGMRLVPDRLVAPVATLVVAAEAVVVVLMASPFTAGAVAGLGLAATLLCVFRGAVVVSLRRAAELPAAVLAPPPSP